MNDRVACNTYGRGAIEHAWVVHDVPRVHALSVNEIAKRTRDGFSKSAEAAAAFGRNVCVETEGTSAGCAEKRSPTRGLCSP